MRSALAVLVVALGLILAGCGGDSSDLTFPPLGAEQDGYPSAEVSDEPEADELCTAAQEQWPNAWADAEAVTLDIPSTNATSFASERALLAATVPGMSLAVARLLSLGPRIAADVRITDPNAAHSGYLTGALKAVVLHRDLCVAYAGAVGLANETIRALPVERGADFDLAEVEAQLLAAHRDSGGAVDFLVGALDPTPSLSRIVSAGVERDLTAAWIGDQAAFELYQSAYQAHYELSASVPFEPDKLPPGVTSDDLRVKAAMSFAVGSVVHDPAVPSVGELEVVVDVFPSRGDGLCYAEGAMMVKGKDQILPASGEATTIVFEADPAHGGFAYSTLVPSEPGIGALGVHFYQGNLGMLLFPQEGPEPIRFSNVNHAQFVAEVERRFGISLEGPALTTSSRARP